jgi:hypothetical protein
MLTEKKKKKKKKETELKKKKKNWRLARKENKQTNSE